jgi:hypothetical protein
LLAGALSTPYVNERGGEMSGARGGIGRIVATGVALALTLLLVLAAEARAGKYAVAQCGWHVGLDADWADTTGGVKFRPDAYCVPPGGGDPFAGSHVKSFTRGGESTVTGTRFARWRWSAPAGTAITQIRGTIWHALHDGMEQRVGAVGGGGFVPFLSGASTNVAPREFVAGFAPPVWAIEDRLLCARAESKWCSLAASSWSSLRAVTITLEEGTVPGAGIGGELFHGGWRRGVQGAVIWGADTGSGIRYGETTMDGVRIGLTEYPCVIASIGGEWRGGRMQPCQIAVSGTQSFATTAFSDGPHAVRHCVTDFSGNVGCVGPYAVAIDNNPPAHPRSASPLGGDGWRRTNDFDLSWANPDQGAASPIAGASWRLTGPGGHDGGVKFAAGRNLTTLPDLKVPGPGAYTVALWLRDEAGNEAPGAAVGVPLRFDDVPPKVDFLAGDDAPATLVEAEVSDAHSGPAKGELFYRRSDSAHWVELAAKLVAVAPGKARVRAPLPELGPGTYAFRADVADAAGNTASTGRRGDGAEMTIRRLAPAEPVKVVRAKSRLFARLGGGRGDAESRTVPFGRAAKLSGRLTRADGAGLAGRELRVVARPSRGALTPLTEATVRTGERGGFELPLGPGPSRRVAVVFPGDQGYESSARRSLELRVRAGVSLRAERTELMTGQRLRLSGRVRSRGARIPRRGKLVAIHYLERETERWRPVLVTRTDHEGRFRASYRFRYVSGRARIQLRATVLAEERWPYVPGSSPPLTVDVSGR